MRPQAWWYAKANAIAPALGACSRSRVCLLLAVATHETSCGDSWPGECNWGATTRGLLSPAERVSLVTAGVLPVLSPPDARHAAEARANAVLGARADRTIHVDSRPATHASLEGAPRVGFHALAMRAAAATGGGQIPYFTWFARFATDAEGAAYFVSFFHTAGELAALQGVDPGTLARAMYSAHYYTGFSPDAETDIAAYTAAIAPLYGEAMAALASWTPGAVAIAPPPEPAQGWSWRQVQVALSDSGVAHLAADNLVGPLTRAALRAFQAREGLPVTALADEATVQALRGGEANA